MRKFDFTSPQPKGHENLLNSARIEHSPRSTERGHLRNSSVVVRQNALKEAGDISRSVNVPKGQFRVSIQDMVASSKKTNDEWGVEGYEYVKYNAHFDKPTVFSISKDSGKPRDYISML